MHPLRPLLLCILMVATVSQAALRDDLSLVTDLAPKDSVVSLHPIGDNRLLLKIVHDQKLEERQLSVSTAMQEKLLKGAAAEGRKGDEIRPEPVAKMGLSEDLESRNRTSFNRVQGAFGAAAFYTSMMAGVQPTSGTAVIGLALLGYPASYLGHYLYSRDRLWTDAHLDGTTYGSSTAYFDVFYGTLALGGFTGGSVQAAAWTSLIAYPIGLHAGYLFGGRYTDNPGRVTFVQSLASQGMFTGGLLPLVFADFDNMSSGAATTWFRMSALGAIGGTIGGHILAQNMLTDRHIPAGVGPGINTLAGLTAWTGFEIAALAAGDGEFRPNLTLGLVLAGNTVGALTGLSFLPDRGDTKERSTYIGVGTSLGVLGGLGVMFLGNPESPTAGGVMAYPTVGAWIGYAVTTMITTQLVEKQAKIETRSTGLVGDISLASTVVPEPTDHGMRWSWPGLRVSLR